MNRDVLCRPFPPEQIKKRPGRNGSSLSYVETHAVITRLNEGCDSWNFEVVQHQLEGDEVIVLGKLTADGVIKMAFGGSAITMDGQKKIVSIADDLKAAASDSLKKCASLLGVGLELYGAAPVQKTNGNGKSTPGNGGTTPTNGGSTKTNGDGITPKQSARIYSACRRRCVSREELESLVKNRTGKSQLDALTRAEASSIIEYFQTGLSPDPQ